MQLSKVYDLKPGDVLVSMQTGSEIKISDVGVLRMTPRHNLQNHVVGIWLNGKEEGRDVAVVYKALRFFNVKV